MSAKREKEMDYTPNDFALTARCGQVEHPNR